MQHLGPRRNAWVGPGRLVSLFTALLFTLVAGTMVAQTAPATYWVQFKDKAHTPYSLGAPEAFLSQRAIDRRARQHIPIDSLDLPVDPAYIVQLQAACDLEVLHVSKWFNAATIRSTDTLALDSLGLLPFVNVVQLTQDGTVHPHRQAGKFPLPKLFEEYYGDSFRQIAMMNGHLLHELGGAKGQGMLVGVLDAGFLNADILPGLADLRARNGILLTRDLVVPGGNVYAEHYHGRSVLSVMAGHVEGKLAGTAPLADYVLVRTENGAVEYRVEEDNWVAGAELCDSLGCDVLNTSLGYSTFDDPAQDHTYADMNGLTSRMTMASDIASRKGMVVVSSAGNSAQLPWHHITAPADAFDILAVGAVDTARQVAPFSSRGPSADGRVKPDVSAMGFRTVGLDGAGWNVGRINGTSFSAPLVAGLSACLWQLHQDRSAHDVMDAIRRSASQYDRPDDDLGYGIPDFWRAHLLLGGRDITGLTSPAALGVVPNPFIDFLDVEVYTGNETTMEMSLVDLLGQKLWNTEVAGLEPHTYAHVRVQDALLTRLRAGTYILRVEIGGFHLTRRVVKAR